VQYPVGLVDYPAIQNLISACLFLLFQYALVVPQQFLILKSVRDCTNNYFPLVIDHEGGSLLFVRLNFCVFSSLSSYYSAS
jgi:hypothetical protein